jgi:hypothetical protein
MKLSNSLHFAILLLLSTALVTACKEKTEDEQIEAAAAGPASDVEKESESAAGVQIGQTLKTKYFDVTVNSAKTSKDVKTGNEFGDVAPEEGNKFLIIDITLKNTDNESRMMFDGEVKISYNGKEYKYEQPELIAAEGWGMIMDNINPLVTKKTKLVYKIPAEITGEAFYYPARSGDDDRISLGTIQ